MQWFMCGVMLIDLLVLLYDAPIRRQLKRMPSWTSLRKDVARQLKGMAGRRN